ncbi:MAG: hypothetical protein QXX42_01815 [Thermoplasmatales archaeon]
MTVEFLYWATKYVENGIRILPISRESVTFSDIINAKPKQQTLKQIPLVPNTLKKWFESDENNIAILLGPESGNLIAVSIEDIELFDKYVPHTTTEFFNTFAILFKNIRTYFFRYQEILEKSVNITQILPNLKITIYLNGTILAPPSIINNERVTAISDLNIITLKDFNEFIKWLNNIDKSVGVLNILKNYKISEEIVYAVSEYAKIAGWNEDQISILLDLIKKFLNVQIGEVKTNLDFTQILGDELYEALKGPFGLVTTEDNEDMCFEWAPEQYICYDNKYLTFYEKRMKYNKKIDDYDEVRKDIIYAGLKFKECVIHDGLPKIRATFNGIEFVSELEEWMRILGNALRGTRDDNKKIRIFLQKYIDSNISNAKEYHLDPIWVNDMKIHVKPTNNDIKLILTKLRELYNITTNQNAFITAMAWSLFAPLSYYFRSNGRPVPFLILSGKSGGKTELLALFIAKGYGQNRTVAILGENSIMTEFTSMRALGDSIMPVVFDDVSLKYLAENAEWLKNIYSHSEAGKRGRSDQTVITYFNKRNIAFTCNQEIVLDSAELERFLVENYTQKHKERENPPLYYSLIDELPDGFMLTLFYEIFNNMDLKKLMSEMWYDLKDRSMFNWKIIEYLISKINILCKQHNVPTFPEFDIQKAIQREQYSIKHDWIEVIFEKLYNEWQKMISGSIFPSAKSSLNEFDFNVEEEKDNYIRIDLTRAGFEKVKKELRNCPYNTLTDLLNNMDPNNKFLTLKFSTHRFNNKITKTLTFIKDLKKENEFLESLEKVEEMETDEKQKHIDDN